MLSVLNKHGPLISAGLHFLFYPNHTADIQSVLQSLKGQKFAGELSIIVVDLKRMKIDSGEWVRH